MHTTKKHISDQKTSFKAAIDTKKVDLKEGDATKKVSVELALTPNRKTHSLSSCELTWVSSHGNLLTCATYQCTMQRCLKNQIGWNMHNYADDIAVMTRKGFDLISDLKDDAADAALQGLKDILSFPPILAAPEESEPMLLYLAASNKVNVLVIVVE
ncbi:hypothetical protein QYE76_050157 [Lolium multiflorum]|uniref:Uncharacterized protein n=1 Tax=Lolium multiflorum TaxID=4521 RepID=A0AAD8SRG1_LOLMU|nr:hypothetical protein QYE76_050157 [Lolium multiflorum]